MTVFYRGRCAYITHEVFQVRDPESAAYLIRELSQVHMVQAEPTCGTLLPRAASIGAGAVAFIAAAARGELPAAAVWPLLSLAVITLSATMLAGCWRSERQLYELRAICRGRVVCLFRTPDKQLLGQIGRALQRAVEHNLDER
ncbi:MAG TPA: DUF6232 family protein [Candidatus Limnocylindrales bacterium]